MQNSTMHSTGLLLLSLCYLIPFGLQLCSEEVTNNGIAVIWPESPSGNYVRSNPPCYNHETEVTRQCTGSRWIPKAADLKPCLQDVQFYNLSTCPPGYYPISKNINEYCYQIGKPSNWEYPCLKGGGATVITELNDVDLHSLVNSLNANNTFRYYWLPAQRTRILNPMIWYVPGSKWGRPVETNNMLRMSMSILKSCLLLDIQSMTLNSAACNLEYPSLCFYINNVYDPGKCPNNYYAAKYHPDYGVCFGIEYSSTDLLFDDFTQNICKKPMGYSNINHLTRFIFKKIAKTDSLSNDTWCWFAKMLFNYTFINFNPTIIENNVTLETPSNREFNVAINNIGTISLINSNSPAALTCMACQTEAINDKTEFVFEYSEKEKTMFLTVYNPSGLWKYDDSDIGIQCFSNANGFVKVIDIKDIEIMEVHDHGMDPMSQSVYLEKTTYVVNLVSNRSAQYWCEGHTQSFSLLSTEKVVVNPTGNIHVFVLVLKLRNLSNDSDVIDNNAYAFDTAVHDLCTSIEYIFNADKVLVMEVLEYSLEYVIVLLHMHVAIENFFEENNNVTMLFNALKQIAQTELPKYNFVFINISSAVYCLPTKSIDISMYLDWGLTPIGHIIAPDQFCLQNNGLPVNRLCEGSYLYGGVWSDVKGTCDLNYLPSETTTFLYMFVKGLTPQNYTSRFLIDGLKFALSNTDIIIPADIYYLSVSLQHVLYLSQQNNTAVDLGNIENMAWSMNRIMILNNNYLRLAQTLNSTNVILDAISKIIELIALANRPNMSRILTTQSEILFQQVVESQYIIQISYPKINNISGIAVCKNSESDIFTDMDVKPLYRNTSLDEVLALDNLEIATWLPDSVLDTLKQTNNESINETIRADDLHLIINVFYNDSVFQELNWNKYKVNSRVVGVSLPGFISNLEVPVPLIYKEFTHSTQNKMCGYWDFHLNKKSKAPGFWSNNGCYLKYSFNNNLSLCECYHLTHFGQLLNVGHPDDSQNKHVKSLNIISLTGSFLSLLGIAGIWITASVFHKWRKKPGTKVLLHLSGSIALPLLYIVVLNLGKPIFQLQDEVNTTYCNRINVICIIFGALLHYFVLSSFMWMLITAILQYIRYVRVLGVHRPSRFMMKLTLIGWGIPTIPVIIILLINKDNYIPETLHSTEYFSPICYPNGFYLLLGVVLPICVILFVNIILYVLVLRAISQGPDGKMRTTDIDLIGAQFRLSIFLFFLLGFTWIFGLLSFTNHLLWSYLFCLTSTLQGFILFIYFIIFDPDTRNLWISLMKPPTNLNKPRESITNISSG